MKVKTVVCGILSVVAGLLWGQGGFPELVGDGAADDTAAIQARLDSGASLVCLPPPKKEYLISRPLVIGSGQELRLDRLTRIRLAPGSDCLMICNRARGTKGRDRNVILTGGIWDFDNLRQSPNPGHRDKARPPLPPVKFPKSFDPNFYFGIAISFNQVDGLRIRDVSVRNPVTYAIELARVTDFDVERIVFDFPDCNPIHSNMDGVHVDGDCRFGRITDIRGTTWDDLVALNACDGTFSPGPGPITDIDIDGLYAEYGHTAVRLLSASPAAPVKRVTIRNVHGNYFRYAVGLTYFFWNGMFDDHGVMDDITIENCFVAKALQPSDLHKLQPMAPIFVDGRLRIGSLTIRNLCREERTEALPTIDVHDQARIETLTIRDCRQVNRLNEPMTFLRRGKDSIRTLIRDNVQFVDAPGKNVDEEFGTGPLKCAVMPPADAVDTRIGAQCGSGSCLLGPCVPHGSVHPSPDSVWPSPGRDHAPPNGCWLGDRVVGFSQLHAQGTGGTPSYGLFRVTFGESSAMQVLEAHPYRFRAMLSDLGTEVDVAATANGAIYSYSCGDPTIDYRCKIGREVASSNAWMKAEGNALFGGGTYFGNWNPAPYDCWFYATKGNGELRIAVSFKSVEEARRFHDAELRGRSLSEIADAARTAWNERLSRVELPESDATVRMRFYTHLYHTFVQPRLRSGQWDDHYTVWDTWKTLFPLMALVDPEMLAGVVNSFADRFERNGRCEVAFVQGKEMRTGQGGNDVDNVIADAAAKDIPGIDWARVWKVVAAHADDRTPEYRERGWVASDARHDYCWRLRSGSATLAFAYNDWCASQVAEKLGKAEEAERLRRRSGNWTNVWDVALTDAPSGFAGFIRGRKSDGTFGATVEWPRAVEPADPRKGYNGSFYEGTCWEYSFNVWHDLPRLIELCGGKETFVRRLSYALDNGLIDFGNEPSFYTPFLFAFADRPDLTDKWAARMRAAFPPDGTPGDDDSGAMGSLYVFLSSGLMPIAGTDRYVLFAPGLPKVVFNLPVGGRPLVVSTTGDVHKGVRQIRFNGRILDGRIVRHVDLMRGGDLTFEGFK